MDKQRRLPKEPSAEQLIRMHSAAEAVDAARVAFQDPAVRASMDAEPHPSGNPARTLGDYVEFVLAHATRPAKLRVAAKLIRKHVAIAKRAGKVVR